MQMLLPQCFNAGERPNLAKVEPYTADFPLNVIWKHQTTKPAKICEHTTTTVALLVCGGERKKARAPHDVNAAQKVAHAGFP
jgi:hypothetical protein